MGVTPGQPPPSEGPLHELHERLDVMTREAAVIAGGSESEDVERLAELVGALVLTVKRLMPLVAMAGTRATHALALALPLAEAERIRTANVGLDGTLLVARPEERL